MITARTGAKVNLFLRVLGRRPDGYHEIETVLHGVSLADDITVEPAPSGIHVDLRFEDPRGGGAPRAGDNLVAVAARVLLERAGVERGARITILKRIPIGAGLGGGSGNAGASLVLLNDLWDLGFGDDDLLEMAGLVGSDVPYCVSGGTALATSRGEKVVPLPAPQTMWFVLGMSAGPLSTRTVYEAWAELGSPAEVTSEPLAAALGAGDVEEIAALLHNDLEPVAVALRPELRARMKALREAGCLGAAVSGSGPTLFGIVAGDDHAAAVARRVEPYFDRVVVCRSQARCIDRLD